MSRHVDFDENTDDTLERTEITRSNVVLAENMSGGGYGLANGYGQKYTTVHGHMQFDNNVSCYSPSFDYALLFILIIIIGTCIYYISTVLTKPISDLAIVAE